MIPIGEAYHRLCGYLSSISTWGEKLDFVYWLIDVGGGPIRERVITGVIFTPVIERPLT